MIALCIGLAGSVWTMLPAPDFTLAWNHTIEKIRWEEDYQVRPEGLQLVSARVRGTGAGMEIPDDARFHDGAWEYTPQVPTQDRLHLGRTPEAGDYQLCRNGHCQPLADWIGPPDAEQPFVEFWSCPQQPSEPPDSP